MRQSPALLNPYFSFSITHGNPISSLSDGRLVAVPTGVVALIEPNTIISNRAQLFGYESILFGPETMGSMLAEVTGAEQSFGGGMTILHGAVLAEAFSRAAELLSRPSALLEREEGLHRFVELVARYFPRQREASRVSASTVRIRRAREYLDAAALEAQNPSLTDLANLTGISKFGLLRAFKRELGITPHAYLVQQRLHRAKVLMKGGASVSQAASLAGFADKSHLTRQFRNSFGITPGAIKGSLSRVPRPD
jgi:AraC-like DNA-binding protein